MANSEGMASLGVLCMIVRQPQVYDPPFLGLRRTSDGAFMVHIRVSSVDTQGRLPEMSNFCCLPGRAGGTPMLLAFHVRYRSNRTSVPQDQTTSGKHSACRGDAAIIPRRTEKLYL